MGIGKYIKEECKKRGMTLKDLSKESGVSIKTIYYITLNDPEEIMTGTMNKLQKALDTNKDMITIEITQEQAELLIEGLETAIRNDAAALSFITATATEAGARNQTDREDFCWKHATELRRTINNLDDLADDIRRVLWYNEDRKDKPDY